MKYDFNSSNIQLTGLDELSKKLDSLQANNPEMEKKIKNVIRKAMAIAKKEATDRTHDALPKDPRDAYKAVKSMVYKSVLGGNVSILSRRKSSGEKSSYEPPRTLRPGQRGGNRVKRGWRTQQMMEYQGADRGFILRFLNSGTYRTSPRTAGTRGGRLSGNRGSISARNWFASSGQQGMNEAAKYIEQEINRLISEEFGQS
ncbi:MAG: hypothetical protein IIZ78_27500 [Clostridiales bacterium]|nr:hypothetical protein [Clostridiales bacterium]